MKPNDITQIVSVGDPQLSPDGDHIAYVVTRIDEKANRYSSQVWITPTDGSTPPRALTAGEHSDASPRWLPDGRALAFTSSRRKDSEGKTKSSIFLLPMDLPGETSLLAESDESIGAMTVSPDGTWVAYTTRTRGPHYESDDIDRRPPRRIDHMLFQFNGEGFVIDRPSHIYVVPTDGSARPRNLTPGDTEYDNPAWFPDNQHLAVEVNDHRLDLAADIGVVDMGGEAVRVATANAGFYASPSVAPDGESIAIVGFDDPGVFPQNAHVGLLDPAGGAPRWISTDMDRTWAAFPYSRPVHWNSDGSLVGSLEDRGNLHVYRVHDGAPPELMVGGERIVTGWSVVGTTTAFSATTPQAPAELFVLVDGEERQLTSVTRSFATAVAPQGAERFTAPSGEVEVDAWIVRPPDFDPEKQYPMLLNVHGGPFTQYGNGFFDEAQLQAAAGFVVVLSNPRGGSGRDTAWGQAILGPKHKVPGCGWGALDYDDLMAVVDTALERYPFIDGDRLGVLGGSYGGYMASWIVTHTNRFKAACSERGVNNLATLEHGSDIAGLFHAEIGPTHLEDPDEYARMSPITYVDALDTPVLIVHSEDDLRCPVEQADQLFLACLMLDKEVEYYRFPGETHELSRSGSPIHRVQRAELILEFFTRHLMA